MTVSWPNRSWNTVVRQYFEEGLYFFRLSLSRSNLAEFERKLLGVQSQQKIHSLNAYTVFGDYDVIIKVWLHGKAVESFRQQLYIQLGLDHTPEYFKVSLPDAEPSRQEQEMLEKLGDDWGLVKRVQSEEDLELFNSLVASKMIQVHQTSHPESIGFFITIGEGASHRREEKLKQVRDQIESRLHDSKAFISWAVYPGQGICPILIEAKIPVGHYYDIGALTKSLSDSFGPDGLHSQSYLFVNHEPLVRGYDIIDDRTLLERRSKEAVVRRYCPAAYEELTKQGDEVAEFLIAHKKTLMGLTRDNFDEAIASLVTNVAASVLSRNLHLASTHILSYCTQLEGDLRARLDSFLLSIGTDRGTAIKQAGVAGGKHVALGDLLKIYDQVAPMDVQTQLAGLVNLRNRIAHSAHDDDDWRSAADTIVYSRSKLRAMYQKITSRAAGE